MLVVAPLDRGALSIVAGRCARPAGRFVVAAIDDDTAPGAVLAHARAEAAGRGVPLRVVHVWTNRRRGMAAADHLTAECIADHLPLDDPATVERQILHDTDPARALLTLSRQAVLMVVAAKPDGSLGGTVRRLAGHTHCPLAIVASPPVTRGQW